MHGRRNSSVYSRVWRKRMHTNKQQKFHFKRCETKAPVRDLNLAQNDCISLHMWAHNKATFFVSTYYKWFHTHTYIHHLSCTSLISEYVCVCLCVSTPFLKNDFVPTKFSFNMKRLTAKTHLNSVEIFQV